MEQSALQGADFLFYTVVFLKKITDFWYLNYYLR